ncbi:hypothetical protein [Paenibacillus glacialis]|uniref:Uncharacterized protein n=1 Tax=Paenibacillus glacialis TaxID=494026 RepID=A0A168MCJ8_9BACL|nr:hypothetical protein [Paenibacillus glacialis]OAB44511.1 hypothetical protein PGLA_07605 [Paenibacillus glacialis]
MTQLQSVQAWSDEKLDEEILEITDRMASPTQSLEDSLEVQAKAIERKPREYAENLIRVVNGDFPLYQLKENYIFNLHYLNQLLQATPRQRAEATYLTIKAV